MPLADGAPRHRTPFVRHCFHILSVAAMAGTGVFPARALWLLPIACRFLVHPWPIACRFLADPWSIAGQSLADRLSIAGRSLVDSWSIACRFLVGAAIG